MISFLWLLKPILDSFKLQLCCEWQKLRYLVYVLSLISAALIFNSNDIRVLNAIKLFLITLFKAKIKKATLKKHFLQDFGNVIRPAITSSRRDQTVRDRNLGFSENPLQIHPRIVNIFLIFLLLLPLLKCPPH